VELEPGVYGFLKFNELKDEEKPAQPLEVEKTYQFSIKSINLSDRRISLGL